MAQPFQPNGKRRKTDYEGRNYSNLGRGTANYPMSSSPAQASACSRKHCLMYAYRRLSWKRENNEASTQNKNISSTFSSRKCGGRRETIQGDNMKISYLMKHFRYCFTKTRNTSFSFSKPEETLPPTDC